MKDIHSHLLPGIDDGASNIEESIKLLKELYEKGVTEIVLTPHYINNSKYICNVNKKREIFDILLKKIKKEKINIKLYLGNEIFIDDSLVNLLENNEIETINNSKYLLIEFSLFQYPKNALNILNELIFKGYKIIIAHPERYSYIDFKFMDELKEIGVLFQGNYLSLYDEYGKNARKNLKKMLKKGYISFLASDVHHKVNLDIKKLRRKLRWIVKKDEIDKLLNDNFDNVINNIDMEG